MTLEYYPATKMTDVIVPVNCSLRDILQKIEESGIGCAVIVDGEGKFVRLVTDGDARRKILAGARLTDAFELPNEGESFTVTKESSSDDVLQIMEQHSIHQLPLLDGSRRLEGLYLFHSPDLGRVELGATGFVLAGGKGLRLRPLTEAKPKPLVKIGNTTLLELTLNSLARSGIKKVFISVNYLGDQIIQEIGDGSRLNLEVDYVKEDFEMGTAGSLRLLLDRATDESIVVSNADLLHRGNLASLAQFHERESADITVMTIPYKFTVPYGVLEIHNGTVIGVREKPSFTFAISGGVYVVSRRVLKHIPRNQKFDMPDLIQETIDKGGKVVVHSETGPWIDVGTPDNLETARQLWTND